MSNDKQEPEVVAHMYSYDLKRMQTSETFCTVYSVKVGSPTQGTTDVELITLQSHREAMSEKEDAAFQDDMCATEMIIKRNKAIAKKDAALQACVEALNKLLKRDQRNTCQHENTHRGGAIWEICDDCGAKWADDNGGKPKWKEPKEWTVSDAAITQAQEALK